MGNSRHQNGFAPSLTLPWLTPAIRRSWETRSYCYWLSAGIGYTIAAVLLRSAMFHVENNFAFLATLYAYTGTPLFAIPVAAVLPYLQVTLGVMLLFFPPMRFWAFAHCTGLFLIFALAQASVYARGVTIDCGCFSPAADTHIGLRSISIALGCALASLAGIVLSHVPNPSLLVSGERASPTTVPPV
jgi:hypothetical protein